MKRSVATFAAQMFGSGRAILSLRDSYRRDQFLLSVLSAAAVGPLARRYSYRRRIAPGRCSSRLAPRAAQLPPGPLCWSPWPPTGAVWAS